MGLCQNPGHASAMFEAGHASAMFEAGHANGSTVAMPPGSANALSAHRELTSRIDHLRVSAPLVALSLRRALGLLVASVAKRLFPRRHRRLPPRAPS